MTIDTAEFANCPGQPGFVGDWNVSQLDDVAAPWTSTAAPASR